MFAFLRGIEKMTKAGVIGFPIHHSKSPAIHNYWLKKYGIDASYDKYEVRDIADFMKNARDFAGFNVTVPHKTAVIPFMDGLSEQARKAGAVNTVVVRPDGALYGHNTDGVGFIANVSARNPAFDLKNSVVTVLGTGGAARGICAAMSGEAAEIRLVYRTLEKAQNLKNAVGGNVVLVPWADRQSVLQDTDLLANATTLGMNGFDELDIDLSPLKPSATVADLVYAPVKTKLLEQAEQKGFVTADGLGMLLEQARPAFRAFFGVLPEITDELRALIA